MPYHFGSDMKGGKRRDHFASGASEDVAEKAKAGTWVDFLAISKATWTLAFRPSDFSKVPSSFAGSTYAVNQNKVCIRHKGSGGGSRALSDGIFFQNDTDT